jgi:hypothetical protein
MRVIVRMPAVRVAVRMPIDGGVRVHVEFPSGDATFLNAVEMAVNLIPEAEGRDGALKDLFTDSQITQRADHHIAADARETIQVQNSHGKNRGDS